MATDPYVVAGVNLRPFVLEWLSELNNGGGESRGLLEYTDDMVEPDSRYSYGATFLMANIGPRAVPRDASSEVMLFYAVMALYSQADFPGADPRSFDGLDATSSVHSPTSSRWAKKKAHGSSSAT